MNAYRIGHNFQHILLDIKIYFQFIPCIRSPLKSKVNTFPIYRLHAVRFGQGELKVQSKQHEKKKQKNKTSWLINRVSICDLPCHRTGHLAYMRTAFQIPKSRSTLYAKSMYERTYFVLLFRISTLYIYIYDFFCSILRSMFFGIDSNVVFD